MPSSVDSNPNPPHSSWQAHKLTTYILGEYSCHPFLGSSQYFTVSRRGELRNEYMCAQPDGSVNQHSNKVNFFFYIMPPTFFFIS